MRASWLLSQIEADQERIVPFCNSTLSRAQRNCCRNHWLSWRLLNSPTNISLGKKSIWAPEPRHWNGYLFSRTWKGSPLSPTSKGRKHTKEDAHTRTPFSWEYTHCQKVKRHAVWRKDLSVLRLQIVRTVRVDKGIVDWQQPGEICEKWRLVSSRVGHCWWLSHLRATFANAANVEWKTEFCSATVRQLIVVSRVARSKVLSMNFAVYPLKTFHSKFHAVYTM